MDWIRQITAYASDQVRVVQWFMLCRLSGILLSSVIIARTLPIQEVGIFELLMLCGYLLTFFWSDAFLRGYLVQREKDVRATDASSFLGLCFLTGAIFMIVLVAGSTWIVPAITDRASLLGLPLFAIYQALILPVWLAPLLGAAGKQTIILISVFVLLGPSFSCWVGFSSIPDLRGVLIGLMSYALVGFVWVMGTTPKLRKIPVWTLLSAIWPVTWPLIMYALSLAAARSFDAWLVARHFDESTFAIFRYGAREFPVVVALAAGLSTSMIARILQPQGMMELRQRSERLMHICYPLVAILMLCSAPLFRFFFGPEYSYSAFIFNIYLLLSLTQLVFPQTVLSAKGETRLLWHISLLELLVNISASLLLLRYFGLIGIVWGTLIAFVFEKIVLLIVVGRRCKIGIAEVVPVKTWVGYAILLVITFIVAGWMSGM